MAAGVDPFRIAIPDQVIGDLRARLRMTRFTQPTPGEPWSMGTDLRYLEEMVRYWADEFDWRSREVWLNGFAQYTTRVNGRLVHFAHVRGKTNRGGGVPIPIVLSHGWPYTFAEMLEIVPYLVDPLSHGGEAGDLFDVVVPSLPGYGFSEPLGEEPFVSKTVADMWHQLMTGVLGYPRYATYGEDVGTGISDWTAALHPDAVIGLFATHAAFPPEERLDDLTPDEESFRQWLSAKWQRESAYSAIQATKPDTLAAGLNDSPAGLLAWLVEKFRTWSGGEEGFRQAWTDDQILTTATIYWVTGTIGSSFRPYVDDRLEESLPMIDVPVGVSVQQGERGFPRSYAGRTYSDIRLWNDLTHGGHFTAKQTPDLVANDMRVFFRELRD
jgi:epoxide hydrolase